MRAVNLLPRDAERARVRGSHVPRSSSPLARRRGDHGRRRRALLLRVRGSERAAGRARSRSTTPFALVPDADGATSAVSQAVLVQERTDRGASSALAAALSTRIPFDRLLRELALVLPRTPGLPELRPLRP